MLVPILEEMDKTNEYTNEVMSDSFGQWSMYHETETTNIIPYNVYEYICI